MVMDPRFSGFSDYIDDFSESNLLAPYSDSDQYPHSMNQFEFTNPSLGLYSITHNVPFVAPHSISTGWSSDGDLFAPSPSLSFSGHNEASSSISNSSASWSFEGGSPFDDGEFSEPVLRYISQMLLEENMEEKPSMFHDPLALQDAEKSLYAVLAEDYPSPLSQETSFLVHQAVAESPNSDICTSTSKPVDPQWYASPENSYPADHVVQSISPSFNVPDSQAYIDGGLMGSSINEFLVQNIFSNTESVLQFRRGLEEASKFLPGGNQIVNDLGKNKLAPGQKEGGPEAVSAVKNERDNSVNGSKGRKRLDLDLEEERSNKQSAVYQDESELSEMFDKVLLIPVGKNPSACSDEKSLQNGATKDLQRNGEPNVSSGEKTRIKKQGKKKESVDLRSLLLLCAQAISANNRTTADELLKQIRQHSSPLGDGSQRLAHYFADGLEARLDGSAAGIHNFYSLSMFKKSAADMLKAYHTYLSMCPFKKIAIFFANKMILSASEKATTLHIIDFGIMYGFQWPILIQHLSARTGGPPKLRITGIEFPQSGFRPAERIEETGRRLAKYCERFNVPFEYNAIAAQKWEAIQIKDLKIGSNEVVAVNCLFRFKILLDETVDVSSPRNAVLNLIRKINPDIFIHAISNGFYNAPFFVTRFREALFHFSALFDMYDAIVSRENQERLMFEREFYGRAIMNVIACEGSERVERPETYKQWQVRTMRAGFRQIPLDQELMKRFRAKYKAWYHKDFMIDEDNNWMLQGWKGRVLYASSCWVRS